MRSAKSSILILLFTLVSILASIARAQDSIKSPSEDVTSLVSARSRFMLPKLFEFKQFKLVFGKTYGSFIEEFHRKKIYLARAFASFISMVEYKMGRLTSFRSVNQMSDWTPEQRDALIRVDQSKILSYLDHSSGERRELDSLVRTVDKIERQRHEPQFKALAQEIERLSGDQDPETKLNTRRRKRDLWSHDRRSGSHASRLELDLNAEPQEEESAEPMDIDEPHSDVVYVDHRKSGCLTEPKSQGVCSSCSVFASLALAELFYCQQTGYQVQFSEQYMLDCSTFGCSNPWQINKPLDFIAQFGLELAAQYPLVNGQGRCPFEGVDLAGNQALGYIRVKEAAYTTVQKRDFLAYLWFAPIVYALEVGPTFLDYGGGVDQNKGCSADRYHAMLLVGHGREDGREYLLFRNSHSVHWGEEGYYKMDIEALHRCGREENGLIAKIQFEGNGLNENYAGSGLLAH